MNDIHRLAKQIQEGDRAALSKGITLCESELPSHKTEALSLLNALYPATGNSIRIGISGIPGAGKSTLIEALGTYLIDQHQKRVAVLAIDPSSKQSSGSILGDKTRMEYLSRSEHAFIRPSPTRTQLGGVTQQTQAAILLCEAASYDIILVETVGVGQSEIAINQMVDIFLLLQIVGGGDDVQAMKRGVLEWVDIVVFNKADKGKETLAKKEAAYLEKALQLFPKKHQQWNRPVFTCSATEQRGITAIWEAILQHQRHLKKLDIFEAQRKKQLQHLLFSLEENAVLNFFKRHPKMIDLRTENQLKQTANTLHPFEHIKEMMIQLDKLFPTD